MKLWLAGAEGPRPEALRFLLEVAAIVLSVLLFSTLAAVAVWWR